MSPQPPRESDDDPHPWRPDPDRFEAVLALLAHELRNPLAPLRLRVHLARRGRAADPELVHCLDVMDRQLDYLQRMVDELAAWAVAPDIADRSTGRTVDLADVARAGQEIMAPLATARRLRFSGQMEPGPHLVHGNADRLTQMCLNLLGNAFKFTGVEGSVTLRVRRRPGQELLQVRDTGDGIARDQLRRIFEPFTKGPTSGGLGLGLAVVRNVARTHGGLVTAYSAGNLRGSVFTVCLPALGMSLATAAQERRR